MKAKKKQKKVKKASSKPKKKATKKQASSQVSKKKTKPVKKSSAKKVKSAKKSSSKKPVKKVSKKKATKKILKKDSAKKTTKKSLKKESSKKPVIQKSSSYLAFLEDELKSIKEKTRQVSIKNPDGLTYCFEENCDQTATTGGYCRYHYLVHWNQLKTKDAILSSNKLKTWVDQLVQSHSPRLLDYMIRDLSNEKDFEMALSDMKIKAHSSI